MTDLIVLPKKQSELIDIFGREGGTQQYIDALTEKYGSMVFDVTTAKGIKECKSAAREIATAKTALWDAAMDLNRELKAIPKLVDAEKKRAKEAVQALQDKVREPVTRIEQEEKARQERVQAIYDQLNSFKALTHNSDPIDIDVAINDLSAIDLSEAGKDTDKLAEMVGAAFEQLTAAKEMAEERERQAAAKAEQERIERERQQAERDAEIKRQAEENAKREAAEREEQLKREAEKAEQRRIKAEQDAAEAAERAEKARVEAEAKAKRDAEEAAERARIEEQQRIESERQAKEAADRKRAEDREHARGINNAIAEQLVKEAGITEEQAKAVVRAIASNVIDHVTINY